MRFRAAASSCIAAATACSRSVRAARAASHSVCLTTRRSSDGHSGHRSPRRRETTTATPGGRPLAPARRQAAEAFAAKNTDDAHSCVASRWARNRDSDRVDESLLQLSVRLRVEVERGSSKLSALAFRAVDVPAARQVGDPVTQSNAAGRDRVERGAIERTVLRPAREIRAVVRQLLQGPLGGS